MWTASHPLAVVVPPLRRGGSAALAPPPQPVGQRAWVVPCGRLQHRACTAAASASSFVLAWVTTSGTQQTLAHAADDGVGP